MTFSKILELAATLPMDRGWNGACTTLSDVAERRAFVTAALRRRYAELIIAANMERGEHFGHGNKAARPLPTCFPPNAADVAAERVAEARIPCTPIR